MENSETSLKFSNPFKLLLREQTTPSPHVPIVLKVKRLVAIKYLFTLDPKACKNNGMIYFNFLQHSVNLN